MTTEPGTRLAVVVGGDDPELSKRLSAELTVFNNRATGADDEADLSVEVGRSEGFPGGYSDLHFIKRLDGSEPRSRVRVVVLLDVPEEHLSAFGRYEERVLPLLAEHGGRLEQRLRTGDGRTEVHLLSFTGRDGYDSYLADPRRAAYRDEELPGVELAGRVLEVSEVVDPVRSTR
ncbi:hypothetical protein [Plantactinospora sp. KLBMP9567]|uniref:hypothetical protein n=1 Tax=Plantactinospora sp. KLBMP9567 TaxID=3085900 RepID=UPI00298127A2|nr:hypothetical protein [Plantactinospora sp. KLBMP9567]MDW5327316.1 hypothetical protein [Plantactinospora sp. KLBMP9567]